MSYHKITAFAVKDTLADANPLKVVRGKEFDDEFDAITAAMDLQENVIANLVTTPPGGIIMYGNAVAPRGFLLCDGTAKSRNTYNALFQAIGTTFGGGDGSTTFNVPNMSNRFPYGGLVGQVGGSADATLPSHSHSASATVSINDPGHVHTYSVASGGGSGGFGTGTVSTAAASSTSTTGITAGASVAVGATGVSSINANLPPFIGLNFIIKT